MWKCRVCFSAGLWALVWKDFEVLEIIMMLRACRKRSTVKIVVLLLLAVAWCVPQCVCVSEAGKFSSFLVIFMLLLVW